MDSAPVSGTGGCRIEAFPGHTTSPLYTPVAQRKECQSTKLRMGVRFSPGVPRHGKTHNGWRSDAVVIADGRMPDGLKPFYSRVFLTQGCDREAARPVEAHGVVVGFGDNGQFAVSLSS